MILCAKVGVVAYSESNVEVTVELYCSSFLLSTDLQAQLRGPQQALDRFGEGQRVPAAGGARGVRLVRRG